MTNKRKFKVKGRLILVYTVKRSSWADKIFLGMMLATPRGISTFSRFIWWWAPGRSMSPSATQVAFPSFCICKMLLLFKRLLIKTFILKEHKLTDMSCQFCRMVSFKKQFFNYNIKLNVWHIGMQFIEFFQGFFAIFVFVLEVDSKSH